MVLTLISGYKQQNAPQSDAFDNAPMEASVAQKISQQSASLSAEGAIAVVKNYYNAIDRGQYQQAYSYWDNNGSASGQSFDAFKNGFAETSSTQVEIQKPGQIHGAAGSRYIDIPVTITATTTDGTVQQFIGKYTLRRTAVGTTSEQQRWHIYSANISTIE